MNQKRKIVKHNLNATVAKLHAIRGKMLSDDDYSALLSCTSVSDAADYLKRSTDYARTLEGIDTGSIHRQSLEDILRRSYFERYFRILNFEKIGGSDFYNFMTIKTEIDEILICITHLNAGTDDHINTLPIYMNRYTSFDLMDLVKVRSFSELLELVRKTDYFDILSRFKPSADEDQHHIDYAACELALRTYYHRRVLASVEEFGSDVRQRMKTFLGTQIDMINIINAYRMTKYFHSDGKEIKSRMIPIYLRMPEGILDSLYSARDENEFLHRFSSTVYGREISEQGYDMSNPEQALVRLKFKAAKRAFKSSSSAAECFFTFNTLAETEVTNIIRIIEGIRYSLSAKDISALLIN